MWPDMLMMRSCVVFHLVIRSHAAPLRWAFSHKGEDGKGRGRSMSRRGGEGRSVYGTLVEIGFPYSAGLMHASLISITKRKGMTRRCGKE